MKAVIRLYYFINILSIDVVAGAIVSALFFAKIFGVSVRPYGLIALGLTVWIIYTVDHLRDAKKIAHQASMQRHRFHQQHFRILIGFLCFITLMDGISIFFIRKQVFEWGLVLGLFVMIYLIVQQWLQFVKELFVAGLYTCGILILSITMHQIKLNASEYLLMVQFGLIAWINLILFSWFEQEFDQRDKQNSFVTILGKEATIKWLYILLAGNFLLSIVQMVTLQLLTPVLILLLMNATLFFVFQFRTILARGDLYRLIGDAVFLFPILFLL